LTPPRPPIRLADLQHESCEQWCNPLHSVAHCSACACKSCGFCTKAAASTSPAPAVAAPKTHGHHGTSAATNGDAPAEPSLVPSTPSAASSASSSEPPPTVALGYNGLPLETDGSAAAATAEPSKASASSAAGLPPSPSKPACTGAANPTGTCGQWCKEAHSDVHCVSRKSHAFASLRASLLPPPPAAASRRRLPTPPPDAASHRRLPTPPRHLARFSSWPTRISALALPSLSLCPRSRPHPRPYPRLRPCPF